jgi:hypothetical protein
MAIETKVVWAIRPEDMEPGPLKDAFFATEIAKNIDLKSRGLSHGKSPNVNSDGHRNRIWSTTEAAQEWIDFLNQQTTKPISAEIINT